MTPPDIITIDGPAASGKSTIASLLAQELQYLYFDTGVMYRAVTLAALQAGIRPEDEAAVTRLAETVQIDVNPPSVSDGRKYDVFLNGRDVTWEIHSPDVDANVSRVSTYAGVRDAMTRQQRRIGLRGKVVMVGRDIGTVVLPEAPLKIYLDASVEERARRRYEEILSRGQQAKYEEILESLRRRDEIDSHRFIAPLRPASDAKILCTDGMGIEQVLSAIKAWL